MTAGRGGGGKACTLGAVLLKLLCGVISAVLWNFVIIATGPQQIYTTMSENDSSDNERGKLKYASVGNFRCYIYIYI